MWLELSLPIFPLVFFFSQTGTKRVCSWHAAAVNSQETIFLNECSYFFFFLFRYLQQGCTRYFCSKETESKLPASRKSKDHSKNGGMRDPIQDDYKNFFMVDKDLKNLGMSDSDRLAVYTTISAVLHLGNIGKILAFFLLVLILYRQNQYFRVWGRPWRQPWRM